MADGPAAGSIAISPRRRRSPSRLGPAIGLIVLAGLILLERARTYSEPLERDITGYAVIAHEMRGGRRLYSDLWERKPPLLYGVFLVAEKIAGYGEREIYLVNVAAALATLAGIFVAGTAESNTAALAGAGLWVMLCGDLLLEANQPNAEVLVNAALVAAFALLVRWPAARRRGRAVAVLLGICFAAATLCKHHVVLACVALLAGHLLGPKRGGVGGRRERAIECAIALAVLAAAWAGVLAYFAASGRGPAMADILLHQNLNYAASGAAGGGHGAARAILANIVSSFSLGHVFPPWMHWVTVPATLVVAAWMVAGVGGGEWLPGRRGWMWVSWMVGVWAVVALPGQFFPHYYQLWIPPWCVAGGWATAVLLREGAAGWRGVRVAIVVLAFGVLLYRQASQYRSPASQWVIRKNVGHFEQDEKLGQALRTFLRPGERFWNLGEENTIYFAARRSPPTGLLYMEPWLSGDEAAMYQRRLMTDLERANPPLVVVSLDWGPLYHNKLAEPSCPIESWLRANYLATSLNFGCPDYLLLVRRGSNLEQRLRRQGEVLTPLTTTVP